MGEAGQQPDQDGQSDPRESTDDNPLTAKARDAVEKALRDLNFQFLDMPDAPSIATIEEIASKIIAGGKNNDDPLFLDRASQALGFVIFHELGVAEKDTTSLKYIQRAIRQYLTDGTIPPRSLGEKIMEGYYKLLGAFGGNAPGKVKGEETQYDKALDNLEGYLNTLRDGGLDFSFKKKEGYESLVFQTEMDANPEAADILVKLGQKVKFLLTGSVAYADQVPVFRKKGAPLHDIDLLMSLDDITVARAFLESDAFGDTYELYAFSPKDGDGVEKRVEGLAVVPEGYEIRDGYTVWGNKLTGRPYMRGYWVYKKGAPVDTDGGAPNTAGGNKGLKRGGGHSGAVGFMWFEKKDGVVTEKFEGISGAVVDLISDNELDGQDQTFIDKDGNKQTIGVASYVHGFKAKLGMLRYKDVIDYNNVIPPVEGVKQDQPGGAVNNQTLAGRVTETDNPTDSENKVIEDNGGVFGPSIGTMDTPEYIPGLNNEELQDSAPISVLKGFNEYIQRYWKVRQTRENDSVLPFAQVKDFLSELFTKDGINATLIREVLKIPGKKIPKLTKAQLQALEFFGNVISGKDNWLDRIKDNFINIKDMGREDYKYKQLDKFFAVTQEDGSKVVDPNVVGAIAVAAYNFMVLNFEGDGYNTEKDIKRMLGLAPSEKLSDTDWNTFGEGWTLQSNAVSILGSAILNSLGMTLINKVPVEERGKLAVALGSQAMALLLQIGAVEKDVKINVSLKDLEEDGTTNRKPQAMIRVARRWGKKGNPPTYANAAALSKSAMYSENFVGTLFNSDSGAVFPANEPGQYEQKGIRNSNSTIGKSVREVNEKNSTYAWYPRMAFFDFLTGFSEDFIAKINGVKEIEFLQPGNAIPHKSAMNEKSRNWESTKAFILGRKEKGTNDEPFYLIPQHWSNGRNGYANNVMDAQTNKIARFLMSMGAWKTEVPTQNGDFDPITQIFLAGIAVGFGYKSDKQSNETTIGQLNRDLNDKGSELAIAMKAMSKLADPDVSIEERAIAENDLLALVNNAGENLHSLDSLYQLYNFQQARANGQNYTADILIEADGVTNGAFLFQAMLGVLGIDDAAKFGLYPEGDIKDYPSWKGGSEPGNVRNDQYQMIVSAFLEELKGLQFADKQFSELAFSFLDDFGTEELITSAGRNFVKEPTTAVNYGAGFKGLLLSTSGDIYQQYRDQVQEAANKEGATEQEKVKAVNEIILRWNRLANTKVKVYSRKAKKYVPIPLPNPMKTNSKTLDEALAASEMTSAQMALYQSRYNASVGVALTQGMTNVLGNFIDSRDKILEATRIAWERHNIVKDYLTEMAYEDAIAAGEIEENKGKEGRKASERAKTFLPPERQAKIDKALEPIINMIHTIYSKRDSDISSGLRSEKTEKIDVQSGSRTQQSIQVSELNAPEQRINYKVEKGKDGKFAPLNNDNSERGIPAKTSLFEVAPPSLVSISPGVKMGAIATQSVDSAIMMDTTYINPALNVHDAPGVGVNGILKASRDINRATFENLLEFSIPGEILAALNDSFANMEAVLNTKNDNGETLLSLAPEILFLLESVYETVDNEGNVTTSAENLFNLKQLVAGMENRKLQMLRDTRYVNQYAMENGYYELTEADYERVDAALKKNRAVIAKLQKEREQQNQEQTNNDPEPTKSQGKEGKSRFAPDSVLEGELAGKPKTSTEALDAVLRALDRNTEYSVLQKRFIYNLAKLLKRALPRRCHCSIVDY